MSRVRWFLLRRGPCFPATNASEVSLLATVERLTLGEWLAPHRVHSVDKPGFGFRGILLVAVQFRSIAKMMNALWWSGWRLTVSRLRRLGCCKCCANDNSLSASSLHCSRLSRHPQTMRLCSMSSNVASKRQYSDSFLNWATKLAIRLPFFLDAGVEVVSLDYEGRGRLLVITHQFYQLLKRLVSWLLRSN